MLMSKTIGVSLFAIMIASSAQAQQIGDVFYIDLENHNFTQPSGVTSPQQLLGNAAAPFLNSLIMPGNPNAAMTSYASNYQNVPGVHPSEPNYVWQEAGLHGPLNDNDPYPNNIVNAPNLSALLQTKYGASGWKSYQEDIDINTSTGQVLPQSQWTVPTSSQSGTFAAGATPNAYNGSLQFNFAAKHDGQLFFTATNGGTAAAPNTSPSNPEAQFYAPLQQFQTDLTNNTVARYNLITPDQYNDMHTALTGGFTYQGVHYTGDAANIAQGDNFLSIIIPEIEASQAFQNNGVIVIWNDETEGEGAVDTSGFTSTEIVISKLAKGNAYTNTTMYTHSSDLATLQEIFGVGDPGFLGGAAGATDLSDLFQPGVIPGAVPEPSTWVMMGLGFAGLAGAAAYRRKQGGTAKPAVAG
jgi:hypothetical protein